MLCAKDGLDLFNRLVIIIFSLESKSRAVVRCGCAPGEKKILHPKKPRKKEDFFFGRWGRCKRILWQNAPLFIQICTP